MQKNPHYETYRCIDRQIAGNTKNTSYSKHSQNRMDFLMHEQSINISKTEAIT